MWCSKADDNPAACNNAYAQKGTGSYGWCEHDGTCTLVGDEVRVDPPVTELPATEPPATEPPAEPATDPPATDPPETDPPDVTVARVHHR